MALSCKINEQLFTFNGKEYNYNEFRALMYDGLLDQALKPAAPAAQVAATTAPKGAVDASDADAMQGLMERHEGINANKVSKPQLIGRVVNGVRWLTNNKLGYDANTGKGNRIFVAESKAEYERITKDASGKAKTGGGVAIPRYDADGNYMGADIYINLDTKSLGTVAHELAHVALMEKFAGDPKLFKKFVAAIKPFTSAKDLAYLDKFIRQYPDEDARPEEFLAEMTAKIEERFVDGEVGAKELSALRKLAEAIKQFINKLTGGLVFPLEKESDVRAFFNALGQSIAVGGVMKEGLAEAAAREVGVKPEVAERREAVEKKEEEGRPEITIKKKKDGSIVVLGSAESIRSKIPSDIKGREIKGGIRFTGSVAPRVIAAIEGRLVAYSRAGEVLKQLPMKDGKYVGAPEKFNTPQKIVQLRKILKDLTLEGQRGKYWYENSGKAVLKMVAGNVEEAKKFVALLSIYSPQAKVDANSTFALRAWAQYKAGLPIKVKTGSQDKKAQQALENIDKFWSGEKTGNFFYNLMREIDPSTAGKQGATIDMWMMRAGQYDNDAPTATQYAFMENETNRLAQELGWEPQQVQAAIWVAMKARMENSGVKKKTESISEKKGWIRFDYPLKKGKPTKTRVILDKQNHRDNWLKQAFAHFVTNKDTQQAKFDFGDGLKRHIGQLSFEARPSTSSNILPGIHSASYEQQLEFQQAVQAALLEEDGSDRIAQLLGLLVDDHSIIAPGVWQGEVSPSNQKLVAMAPAAGEEGKTTVDPAQAKALNAYAAILGLLTKQDGVGWHKPFYSAKKKDANGLDIDLGRMITPDEAKALESEVNKWMLENGKGEKWFDQFAIISTPTGVRLVNFGIFGNDVLHGDIVKVAEKVLPDGDVILFASDGDMPTNNWKDNPDGKAYIERISAEGSPDVLEWAGTVVAPRVQQVFDEFSKKYGWGDPGRVFTELQPRGDGGRQFEAGRFAPLAGAPSVRGFSGPDPRIVEVAEQYAKEKGIDLRRQSEYVEVDEARAKRIADAYANMEHNPNDPKVKKAYSELISQTLDQYKALESAGYRFWFIDPKTKEGENYLSSPWNPLRDLRANQSMGVYPTDDGFGTSNFDVSDNPLLADTGIKWPVGGPSGKETKAVTANDLFRAVHDAFGHGIEGSGFRARGEENAWQAHVRLFTGDAIGALTSETRGQNSWLNYGPYGETNRTAKIEDTVFADQKTGLMPEWTWTEGRVGDMPKPRIREIMERKEDELPPDTPEETRKVITVAKRRLDKIEGDEKRATERDVLMGDPGNYVEEGDYRTAIDQARNFVAELYFKYANLSPVDFSKAVYEEVKGISNEVSKVVAYGELQASLDMYAESKKLSSKDRKEIQRISAKMVSDMAQQARRKGQANAALALVYSNYGKFASLVQAERISIDLTAKLNSTEGSEEGKTIADNIEEARDEIKETLGQNKEIADVVDLAEEINDALEDGQAAKIAAGKSTPLDQPKTVTAEQLVNDPSSYEKIISDLEAEVKRLDGLLAEANKLYSSAAADAASYAQQIADLNREINRKNKLIDKLKAKKDEIAKERDKYKSQLETLKQKIQDLKDINKLLAQKRVGKNRLSPSVIEKLRQQLLDLALAGKLNDPDFDSVFAAITGSNFLTTQDRKAIEHMANALKYFESAGSKEMAQKYVKRLNDYLEQQSKSPWTAAKVAMFLESLFYNSVLSSIGTLQNAFVGSILVSIPNATATSISTALKNKKSGLGAMLYGVMRMLKELPTAVSKGAFSQGVYDSMGTSWSVDSVSKRADPFEVHLLNGWMIHLNKVINDPTLLGKSKASVWLIASTLAQATRVTALMKFIDPVLRHSIAAHMEGMHDYIRIKEEMRLKKEGDASIAEAWTPYFSPKLIKKIDEMAGVARADRSVAAFTALREIATMKSKGIPVRAGYARRRTSDIMRSKRDAEQSLVADKMAADMSMMWRPDGMIGNAWDKSKKYFSIREDDGPFKAFGKLFTNLTLLPFLRISGSGVNIIQTTTPVIGWFFAKYGRAKDKNGDWYWGSKKSENIEDREFAVRRMGMRIAVHHLSCLAFASLMMNVFDLEDGEDEDEEGNVTVKPDAVNVFGYNMLIKLDPDRWFDFTADARGSKSANQGISEGRENFSFRMRLGSDDEWTDWISVRLAPHMTIPVAWLGRLSDDANRLYAEPAFGSGKVPGRAKFYEYFTTLPLTALGEVSFQTLPRAFSKAKYDTGGAVARMFMSPVAAIAQPAIYRDVVSTAASMAGASRRGEYMPEGLVETSKAMFSSLYGLNYMVSPEVTDEYGLPIKAIDPIRSWWKNYTEIEERSDDYPEVNLRWRYGNTFIAATPRAQRLESVDRDISTIPLKEGVYSKTVELTKEQQYESALMAKALYRLNTLRKYDYIIAKAEAEKAKGKRGQMPGEVVSEELNSVHNETMQIVKSVFSQYASGSKDWTQEKVLKAISEIQTMADERSKQIMEGKPLPPAEKELQYYVGKNVIRVVM